MKTAGPRGLLFAALVLAVGLRLLFLGVSLASLPVSADESVTVLQAKGILRGDRPLLFMGQPYAFPLESYLMAPLVGIMPRNAFGARWLAALMGLAGLALGLILWRRLHREKKVPGRLLILFPSAYFLMLQFGYALPLYGSSVLLWYLVVVLAAAAEAGETPGAFRLLAAGIMGGLALSHHLLSVAVIVPVALYLLFPGRARAGLRGLLIFGAGLVMGLAPLILARLRFSSSYGAVAGTVSVPEAAGRLWQPTLAGILPMAMGINPCLFPDYMKTYPDIKAANMALVVLFLAVLGGATILSAGTFLRQVLRGRWPRLETRDIFIGASWLCVILYAFSRRALYVSPRYLLPAVWAFPFVLGSLGTARGGRLRRCLWFLAAGLALANATVTLGLLRQWRQPGFAAREANLPNVAPAVSWLRERRLKHAYATYAVAYRLDFITDEEVVCSQPYNERFPGWPISYKQEVDNAPRAVYILTDLVRKFRPGEFERQLRAMDVGWKRTRAGEMLIYDSFYDRWADRERPVSEAVMVGASHNGSRAAKLGDGRPGTSWSSREPQARGMSLEFRLPVRRPLSRLTLVSDRSARYGWPYLSLYLSTGSGWREVRKRVPPREDPFEFRNGRPVYGGHRQTLRFPAEETEALRLEIARPGSGRPWSLAEVELYEARLGGDRPGGE